MKGFATLFQNYREDNSKRFLGDIDFLVKEKDLAKREAKLANENYVNKAPAEVVNKEREKAAELKSEIARLKEQLKSQKEESNLELAEEHMLRSMAEQKLAELQNKQQIKKRDTNPFSLTTIPTIAPVERPVESRNVYPLQNKPKQTVRQKPAARPPIVGLVASVTSQSKTWARLQLTSTISKRRSTLIIQTAHL